MKTKNIISKHKLITFQIIKSKIYKKEIAYSNVKLDFKKIAKIIYEYHICDKSILFLNFPVFIKKEIDNLIIKTKHFCVINEDWSNGMLTNQKFSKIKNKIDLILIFNRKFNFHLQNIKEINSFRVPVIIINNQFQKEVLDCDYNISGNFNFFEKCFVNNLFLGILKSILKRAGMKKLFLQTQLKKKKKRKKRLKKF